MAVEQLLGCSDSAAVLFWDASLGSPNPTVLQERLASPMDCWHAGLRLGLGGLPGILDFIAPTWMLSCDPPPDIEATSWRLSLRACLVRMEALRQLGGPRPEFQTLAAAGLEMGHRWIRGGAFLRHWPTLVEDGRWKIEDKTTPRIPRGKFVSREPALTPALSPGERETGFPRLGQEMAPDWHWCGGTMREYSGEFSPIALLPFEDELRFAYYCYGRKWAGWALFRALLTRYVSWPTALRAWRKVMSTSRPPMPAPFRPPVISSPVVRRPVVSSLLNPRVTVLIPTVDRYSYLRTLLEQLRRQTVPPFEIIIVDQTPAGRGQPGLYETFLDLPLKVIHQATSGQCSSRNAGLQASRGDFILLLDDDDEVPANLIENHLSTLAKFGAEVSCGVAEELGAGPLPSDFRFLRASDVFPANNTLLQRAVLRRSGLFDLAYDRQARADGDLGMRLYLAGATLVLNPDISVLHHHAPAGGLRTHKARTVTYAQSRSLVFCRALASASEFYLARRYYKQGQARELYWQSVLGTFSLHGSLPKRTAKLFVGALLLPATLWQLRSRMAEANDLVTQFPQIPALAPNLTPDKRLKKSPGEGTGPTESLISGAIL
jgi:glycosyltransferase involved in cell wall biosynthesis